MAGKTKRDNGDAAPDLDLGDAREFLDRLWTSLGALLQTIDDAEGLLRRRGRLKQELADLDNQVAERSVMVAELNAQLNRATGRARRLSGVGEGAGR